MKKSFKAISVSVVAAVLGSASLGAGLDTSRVPANAGWVVHGDFDQLRKTDVGAYILDRLGKPAAERKFAAFQVMFAFDPRTDIRDVTLYGKGGGSQEGLATFRGNFDTTELLTLLQANESYATETHGRHTIHQWLDEKKGKLTFGAVHTDESVLISESVGLVRKGLDVLDGRALSLAADEAFNGLLPDKKAAFIVAGADLDEMAMSPSASTLQQAASGSLSLAEKGGQVEASLVVTAHEAVAAEQMANVVRGILAFAVLGEQENPGAAMLARRTTVSVDDGTISLGLTAPATEVIGFLKERHGEAGTRRTADEDMPADAMQ